jgi:hypothetical protein
MTVVCRAEDRHELVRAHEGWNGLDYVDVSSDQRTLTAYFLGKLPPELAENRPGLETFLRVEGGRRITGVRIVAVDPVVDPDPEKDDRLVVRLDKSGDFSTYTLRLVGVANIDPRYDSVRFSFKVDCPSDLDCAETCACEPPPLAEPELNYLAKDYATFRQLILDRFALLVPEWRERHVPDVGIMLVELLAYVGDYLSYYQDAVATESYLGTARQRISVRRHARLVDYLLGEGCNARAFVCVEVSEDIELAPSTTAFITGLNDELAAPQTSLVWDDLRDVTAALYEVFEPLVTDRTAPIALHPQHNEIHFYTWGDTECCLEKGSTRATLVDAWVTPPAPRDGNAAAVAAPGRLLALAVGDVLIFEEVLGPVTGLPADADPTRRHAVRLTSVTPGEDPIALGTDQRPTPYVEITWCREDALPFSMCLSAIGAAPTCRYLDNISVAHGNVILVDHGKTQGPEDLGTVPTVTSDSCCECVGEPGDVRLSAGRFEAALRRTPLTFSQPLPLESSRGASCPSAAALLRQDLSLVRPDVALTSRPERPWVSRYDLIASLADDWHFVVEIDDDGIARLRFGDGELGARPDAEMAIAATYRIGNGKAGNVGAESISRIVQSGQRAAGVVTVRNPLAAVGGTDPEPVAEAKLFAPHVFRSRLERAVTADDYAVIAKRNSRVQNASASLAWTGSWYEADVAADPFGRESTTERLVERLSTDLEHYRRIGHDLSVRAAEYVPLRLELAVCALPHYQRAHVKAALLARFGTRKLADGTRGFFHPDELTFGQSIAVSRIVAAAQAVTGVEAVAVRALHRLFAAPSHELENGLLPLAPWEIAQLDNDPNFPEHGTLEITVRGGI